MVQDSLLFNPEIKLLSLKILKQHNSIISFSGKLVNKNSVSILAQKQLIKNYLVKILKPALNDNKHQRNYYFLIGS